MKQIIITQRELVFCLFVSLLSYNGCSIDSPMRNDATRQENITNPDGSGNAESKYWPVGMITGDDGIRTGTLIRKGGFDSNGKLIPPAVLTCAHCVVYHNSGNTYKKLDKRPIKKTIFPTTYGDIEVGIGNSYKFPKYSGGGDFGNDVGIVFLNPLPNNDWLDIYKIDYRKPVNEAVTLVGFGGTKEVSTTVQNGTKTEVAWTSEDSGIRRWGNGFVDEVYDRYSQLRHVSDKAQGPQEDLSTSCMGDSGGPMLSQNGNIIGVMSANEKPCQDGGMNWVAHIDGDVGEWINNCLRDESTCDPNSTAQDNLVDELVKTNSRCNEVTSMVGSNTAYCHHALSNINFLVDSAQLSYTAILDRLPSNDETAEIYNAWHSGKDDARRSVVLNLFDLALKRPGYCNLGGDVNRYATGLLHNAMVFCGLMFDRGEQGYDPDNVFSSVAWDCYGRGKNYTSSQIHDLTFNDYAPRCGGGSAVGNISHPGPDVAQKLPPSTSVASEPASNQVTCNPIPNVPYSIFYEGKAAATIPANTNYDIIAMRDGKDFSIDLNQLTALGVAVDSSVVMLTRGVMGTIFADHANCN